MLRVVLVLVRMTVIAVRLAWSAFGVGEAVPQCGLAESGVCGKPLRI